MKRSSLLGIGAAILVAITGCGGKVVVDAPSGGGQGGDLGSGGAGQGGATSGGCSGPLKGCQPDEYCDYPADDCGFQGSIGVCKKRPPFCDDQNAQTVCGCGGLYYLSACDAALAGHDQGPNAACPFASTFFPCGPIEVCDRTLSYCQRSVSDVGGEPDGWVCINFPTCGDQTGCACVLKEPCGEICSADVSNNVTVTCPGG
ncbi:MAG: hypothetical protein ABI193_08905 [Minicystis sp.]